MAFTGRAVRQGNTNNFGVGGAGAFTRAVSPLGDTLYVFLGAGIVEITDFPNGSGTLTNYQGIPSSSDIGGAFEFGGSLYFTVRGNTNALRRLTNLSTGATENVASFGSGRSIGSCATDGTNVWAYDSAENKLFRFNTTNWALTEIGDVTFETGVTETGVQGMFYWADEGRLYIIGGATDRLYRLPAFADNPSTWLAESVDATVSQWGVNQQGVAGGTVFDGEAYFLGGNPDALYRFERALPLSIETIDEQFIPLGTTGYDLVIDITGNPQTVEVTGHMEGFDYHWDATNDQLHIRAVEVTRLIAGVFWTVRITKGTQILTADIAYNVVKAPPIFETLSMLHLYKDVPINIDILIQNIPNLIVPNARLLGLKSELQEYGMNIKGQLPADANLTVNEGDISMIVPSETGGTSEMHDYAYEIESGTPPAIVSPNWQSKGNYGTLTFTDVNHALGYEWTLEPGAVENVSPDAWNFFSGARNIINPGQVAVTPGNLNVTIKFPNVANASAYEYRLESEDHEVDWTRFVGTFSNGMITTIIPDLQDGVEYTLRLRVASPWVGPPISVTIYGGRIAYSIHSGNPDDYLYVFHTGVADGAQATRIKRILLPTGNTSPGGVAINGDLAYVTNSVSGDYAIYVFNHANVADGDRATLIGKFLEPSTPNFTYTKSRIAIYGDKFYCNRNHIDERVNAFDLNSTYGQEATFLRDLNLNITWRYSSDGLSASEHSIFSVSEYRDTISSFDRNPAATTTSVGRDFAFSIPSDNTQPTGLQVIGDVYFTVDRNRDHIYVFKRDPEDLRVSTLLRTFGLPSGMTDPRGLDIPSVRE